MTWSLRKSRDLYFNIAGDDPRSSGWVDEVSRLREAGHEVPGANELLDWDPSARDSHSNCPKLDGLVRELKDLVLPEWRARAGAICAGRSRLTEDLARAGTGSKGGFVVISFDYMYAMEGAAITWGDFLQYLDAVWSNPQRALLAKEYRDALFSAFAQIRDLGVAGLLPSRIFSVSTKQRRVRAAEMQQSAELWVIAHALAHHILRDGTSRPDRAAQAVVRQVLSEPDFAIELTELNRTQHGEIEADVLAMLLVAGEYAGDADPGTEIQAAEGAMVGLLAVGLLGGDWVALPTDTHPPTLTRMAIAAKVAARRIFALEQLDQSWREELIRSLATMLTFAAWLSEVHICGGSMDDADPALRGAVQPRADMIMASTRLMLRPDVQMFENGRL